jgi:pimeloyl-ACP methyl ester carboxylesterase
MTSTPRNPDPAPHYAGAPNLFVNVRGTDFAYRDLGPRDGVPVVLLNHWGAVLDNFDPRIMDGLASRHRVIATDYRGIGASGGTAPLTVDEMARDTIDLIRALGFPKVDLLGFSLGGFVAQDVALKSPQLVRKLILAGTGPAGGAGISKVGAVSWPLILKGLLTLRDPKTYLFFTSTANGRRSATDFLRRSRSARQDGTRTQVLARSCGSSRRSRRGGGRRLRTWGESMFRS